MGSKISSAGGSGSSSSVTTTIKRTTAQFDKTDATLATITGLSATLAVGSYIFRANLYTSPHATGGLKVSVGTPDTLVASAFRCQFFAVDNFGGLASTQGAIASLGTGFDPSDALPAATDVYVLVNGVITVGTAGTVAVQFAQTTPSGTSSVLVGSHLVIMNA